MIQQGDILQNRYQAIKTLGEGGFGKVYEVIDRRDRGKRQVLKVLTVSRFSTDETKKTVLNLFRREVEVLQQLSQQPNSHHLGIPKVESDGYFIWEPNEKQVSHCLVMEKINGVNLETWLNRWWNCPIGEHRAITWLKQLIEILDKLHGNNFFHRDIKPSNIMLKPNGKLVLIDFGAVKEYTASYLVSIGEREPGTQIISPGYSPSEQITGFSELRSDFFALGRTFVHLLTGQHPIDLPVTDNTQLISQLDWRDKAPQVSDSLANLIDELMAPNIEARPKNNREILQRIAAIEKGNNEKLLYRLGRSLQELSVLELITINMVLFITLLITVPLWWVARQQPVTKPVMRSQQYPLDVRSH
jgi:serine/threonine protein kinase